MSTTLPEACTEFGKLLATLSLSLVLSTRALLAKLTACGCVGDPKAAQTGSGNYSNTVLLTVAADLPPADIGDITFLPASGNFTFVLPAGYTTPVNVYGADAALSGRAWVVSNLVEGVDYTRVDDPVTILTHTGKRQMIRIGVPSSPD